ncbi:AAA family ATPase [Cupriavidus pinatubonensis]|nr:AAA family ATPase [Cupriavidus pinatubonensis]
MNAFLTNPPPELDFVLPGLLAGAVGTLIAPGGMGKTMLVTQLGCELAMGLPLLNGTLAVPVSEPKKVVLFLAEEDMTIMHHRILDIVGVLLPGLKRMSSKDRSNLRKLLNTNLCLYTLAGHAGLVSLEPGTTIGDDVMAACNGARLVVFDPLRRFHKGNENSPEHMSAVVQQSELVAHKTRAAVLLPHHASQHSISTGTGDIVTAGRGTTALPDGVRMQMNLSPVGRELAKEWDLPDQALGQYVQLKGTKANYAPRADTVVLHRQPNSGVLVPVDYPAAKTTSKAARVKNGDRT